MDAPFQMNVDFVSVHLSQVKNLKGRLTLTAYARNSCFLVLNNHISLPRLTLYIT